MNNNKITPFNNTTSLSMNDLKEIANRAETRHRSGERVTLLALAKEFSCTPTEVRKALIDHFGNRVTFTRGRTGGIRIA